MFLFARGGVVSNVSRKTTKPSSPFRLMLTSIQPPVTPDQPVSPKPSELRPPPSSPSGVRSADVRPPPAPGLSLSEVAVEFPARVIPAISLSNSQTIVVDDPSELPLSATPTTLPGEAIEPISIDEVPRLSLREAGRCELPVDELADPPPPMLLPSLSPSPAREPLQAYPPPPQMMRTPPRGRHPANNPMPSEDSRPPTSASSSPPPLVVRSRRPQSPPSQQKLGVVEMFILFLVVGTLVFTLSRFFFSPIN